MIDLFAAITARWTARGLPGKGLDIVQGGAQFTISQDEPLERTQRPYAVLRPVSETTATRSNLSKYEDQVFEVWIVAPTPDQADALRKLVDAALEYAPLKLAAGVALVVLAKSLRHSYEDQYAEVVREYLGKVQVGINRFPG